jgi:hypothetical protein
VDPKRSGQQLEVERKRMFASFSERFSQKYGVFSGGDLIFLWNRWALQCFLESVDRMSVAAVNRDAANLPVSLGEIRAVAPGN